MKTSTAAIDTFVYTYVPSNERHDGCILSLFDSLDDAKLAAQKELLTAICTGEVLSQFYTFYKLPDVWNVWEGESPTFQDVLHMGKKVATMQAKLSLETLMSYE